MSVDCEGEKVSRLVWRVIDQALVPEGTRAVGPEESFIFHDGSVVAQQFRSPGGSRYLRVRAPGQPGEEWRKLCERSARSVREGFPGRTRQGSRHV